MKKFLITAAALGLLSTAALADNFNYPDQATEPSASKSFIQPAPGYTIDPAGSTEYVRRHRNLNYLNEPQHNLKDFIIEGTTS